MLIQNINYLKKASVTTLTCLFSCTLGNWGILALFQLSHNSMKHTAVQHELMMNMTTTASQTQMFYTIALAMLSGLIISILFVGLIIKYQLKATWAIAYKAALGMSIFSMLLMMVTEYLVRFLLQPNENIMQTMHSLDYFKDIKSSLISIVVLISAFLVVMPYNYYKLKKTGKACH